MQLEAGFACLSQLEYANSIRVLFACMLNISEPNTIDLHTSATGKR